MGSGSQQGGGGGYGGSQMGGMPGGGIASMMGGMSPGMGGGMFGGQQGQPSMGTYFGGQGPQGNGRRFDFEGGGTGMGPQRGQFGPPGGGFMGGQGGPYGQPGGGMFGGQGQQRGQGQQGGYPSGFNPGLTEPGMTFGDSKPYMGGGQQQAFDQMRQSNFLAPRGPQGPYETPQPMPQMGGGQFGGGMGATMTGYPGQTGTQTAGLANIFQQFQQGQGGYGQKPGGSQNKPGNEAFRAMMGIM